MPAINPLGVAVSDDVNKLLQLANKPQQLEAALDAYDAPQLQVILDDMVAAHYATTGKLLGWVGRRTDFFLGQMARADVDRDAIMSQSLATMDESRKLAAQYGKLFVRVGTRIEARLKDRKA